MAVVQHEIHLLERLPGTVDFNLKRAPVWKIQGQPALRDPQRRDVETKDMPIRAPDFGFAEQSGKLPLPFGIGKLNELGRPTSSPSLVKNQYL